MAAKIGVISDTHGTLRPDVVERLKDCDYIIHAGDFDRESLLLELEDIGPLCAVRGNNDWGSWTRELPYQRTFTIDGVTFFVTHKREDVPRVLKDEVKVVVFGHSHQYFQSEAGGRLWLNPGSWGRPRWWYSVTPTDTTRRISWGGCGSTPAAAAGPGSAVD